MSISMLFLFSIVPTAVDNMLHAVVVYRKQAVPLRNMNVCRNTCIMGACSMVKKEVGLGLPGCSRDLCCLRCF